MLKTLAVIIGSLLLMSCASNANRYSENNQRSILEPQLTLEQQLLHANQAYEEARLEQAESLFQQIVTQHPGLKDAWFKLGNVYLRQARFKAAIRCFEETIKLDKNDGRAWYNLALTRVKQGVQVLEAAEQVVPQDSEYQSDLINLHKRLLERVKRDDAD
ncbi:MAG: hypothetical protein COW84_06430 [Gammaproteobacteria bacterium CG22_combo_CG10-13_8_21_14_all_40_8]|nr:MAG: hypothetical protein COW84_06430 [Gammaproteobacteria bacterium CG22_combo_CG10-13_8_21_14_all_40_8]